jgi:hypothetical protein
VPLNTNALCSLADVRSAMETPDSDTSLDDVVTEYINEASELIIKTARRQFAPVQTATAYTFKVSSKGRVVFLPYDLQSASQVMLHPEASQLVVDPTDYQLEPFTNSEGVYTALVLSPWLSRVSLRQLKFGNPWCQITGTWGWPTVPYPVKRACIVTVRTWVRKDAQKMAGSIGGEYYGGQELAPEMPATYALPAAARKLLQPYVRTVGAV